MNDIFLNNFCSFRSSATYTSKLVLAEICGNSLIYEIVIAPAGADLDLKARGGIVAHEACGENFRGMASLHAAQCTYVYDN